MGFSWTERTSRPRWRAYRPILRASIFRGVLVWLDPPALVIRLWTTSVCVFEIMYGLSTMASGKRQQALQDVFQAGFAAGHGRPRAGL